MACFATGTHIRTTRGAVRVETLAAGDRVMTHIAGGCRTIIWVGHRTVDCTHHPSPESVWPVRVGAGAFGNDMPGCDLFLSPDHAVHVAGVLIPIGCLINGATIAQAPIETVTYWHVELADHDVILAEGLPCETFLDRENRSAFTNASDAAASPTNVSRQDWTGKTCARLMTEGAEVARVKRRLIRRLEALGHATTHNPAPRFFADGEAVTAQFARDRYRVVLPPAATHCEIVSRTARPADLDPVATDARRLGVPVLALRLDGQDIALTDPRLTVGWFAPEGPYRWTDGAATLDVTGARVLEVRTATWMRYLVRASTAKDGARPAGA